jgi:hypothetical protein
VAAILTTIIITVQDRRHAEARLKRERDRAREQEQLDGAYAVQVVLGTVSDRAAGNGDVKHLVAVVINHARYTITHVEAQFSDGQSMVAPCVSESMPSVPKLYGRFAAGWAPIQTSATQGVLTPRHTGMWFETDDVPVQYLSSPYPVVRWTDRWGTRWEHKRGDVRQIQDGAEWRP